MELKNTDTFAVHTEIHIAHLITDHHRQTVESSSPWSKLMRKKRERRIPSLSETVSELWGISNWHQKKPADRLSVVKCALKMDRFNNSRWKMCTHTQQSTQQTAKLRLYVFGSAVPHRLIPVSFFSQFCKPASKCKFKSDFFISFYCLFARHQTHSHTHIKLQIKMVFTLSETCSHNFQSCLHVAFDNCI